MIETNAAWDMENARLGKQPIYVFEIGGESQVYSTHDLVAEGVSQAFTDGAGNYVYLYQISNDGSAILLGTMLTSSGPVYMADNATQLMVVDNPNGYIYQIFGTSGGTGQVSGDGLVKIADAGFLGARYVSYLDNVFLVAVPGTNP
ncbi:hypothetical protein LCGC14_1744250, partial [marine sediment metagenome]